MINNKKELQRNLKLYLVHLLLMVILVLEFGDCFSILYIEQVSRYIDVIGLSV